MASQVAKGLRYAFKGYMYLVLFIHYFILVSIKLYILYQI